MAITREQAEERLVRNNSQVLRLLGRSLDASGANREVGSVLADSMLRLGYTVSDLGGGPTDTELSLIPNRKVPRFMALADLMLKEGLMGGLAALVDEQDGENRIDLADAAASLARSLERGWQRYDEEFTVGSARMVVGNIASKPQPPDAITKTWLGTTGDE